MEVEPLGHKERWITWKSFSKVQGGVSRAKVKVRKWGLHTNTSAEKNRPIHPCANVLCVPPHAQWKMLTAPNDIVNYWMEIIWHIYLVLKYITFYLFYCGASEDKKERFPPMVAPFSPVHPTALVEDYSPSQSLSSVTVEGTDMIKSMATLESYTKATQYWQFYFIPFPNAPPPTWILPSSQLLGWHFHLVALRKQGQHVIHPMILHAFSKNVRIRNRKLSKSTSLYLIWDYS